MYGKRLLDFDLLFSTISQQEVAAKEEIACDRNLNCFLGAVQALELDFLPITYQPQSGLIGQGGTSKIRQSLLSSDHSLAFKAIDIGDVSRTRTPENLNAMYSLLLAEMQHMEKKVILESP